jgi:hypothetical protein
MKKELEIYRNDKKKFLEDKLSERAEELGRVTNRF